MADNDGWGVTCKEKVIMSGWRQTSNEKGDVQLFRRITMASKAERKRKGKKTRNQRFREEREGVLPAARKKAPPPPSCVQKIEAKGPSLKWYNEIFFANEDIEKLWGYGLSNRAYKLLREPPQNIRYVLDLAKKSDEELLSIKSFGEKALTEVRKALQTIGCIVLE